MAVAHDNSATGVGNNVTTVTTGTFTITGSNMVGLLMLPGQISGSITVSTTPGDTVLSGIDASAISGAAIAGQGGDESVRIWGVIAPPTGASKTAKMTWSPASFVVLIAATASGADQTAPFVGYSANGAFHNDVPVTVISNVGDLAYSTAIASSGTLTGSQTSLYNDTNQAADRGPGSGNTTFTWSTGGAGGYIAAAGVNVIQLGGGGATILTGFGRRLQGFIYS